MPNLSISENGRLVDGIGELLPEGFLKMPIMLEGSIRVSPLSRQKNGLYMVHGVSLHGLRVEPFCDIYFVMVSMPQSFVNPLHVMEEEVFTCLGL